MDSTNGFSMSMTVGIGITNPGTVRKWYPTEEQAAQIMAAAEAANLTLDAYVALFATLGDLLTAVFGKVE